METGFDEEPVTDREVERAKQNILKNRELRAGDTRSLAIALSEWAAQGDWRLYFLFRDEVEALTREKVQAFAERYFARNNRTVGLFIPGEESQRVEIPESPDLVARLDGYEGREELSQGESLDPDPMAIEARTQRGELVGGIRYAMLPKETRGEYVSMMMTLRFGTAEELIDKIAAAELLGNCMARGTEELDFQALQDELTRLRTDLSVSSTVGLVQIQLKTKREFLPEVIGLLTDLIKTPRLDPDDFAIVRRETLTRLEKSTSEPNALAPRAVRRRLSPYDSDDIRYVPTIEEEIQRYKDVTIDQIRSLHATYLGNQAGEIAIVGDFDADATKTRLIEALQGWTSDVSYVRVDQPPHPGIPGSVTEIETPDKANALLYSGQQYELSDETPEYASLVMGNFVLGGGTLSSRLADRVRQQEGLSYGIRSGLTARAKDNRADFILYAITNPQNKDRLLEIIREEINRLREEGVRDEELAQAKEAYLQSERVSRTNDEQLVRMLVSSMFNERTLAWIAEHEAFIKETTPERVNAAVRDFIDPQQLVIAVAGDFAAAAKAGEQGNPAEPTTTEANQ